MPLTKFAKKVIGTLITFFANPQGRGGVNPTITSNLKTTITIKERMRYINMNLKHISPNAEKTFGNLEFAGEGTVNQRRIGGHMTILSRSYNLYSDIQKADDIEVILPPEAGEKTFEFEQRVKLVNPRITAEGYKIGNRGFTKYLLHADDLVKA